MSQENVEIVRHAFEHFLRTGEQQWDAIDPDVEVYDHDVPDAGTYRGHAGYARWLADWGEAWKDFSIRARPKGTTAEIENRVGHVWTLRDGRVVSIHGFPKRGPALEAAGLRE